MLTSNNSDSISNLQLIREVTSREAWALLQQPKARLVDVRTEYEWNIIGYPDLSELTSELIKWSWRLKPDMHINGDFVLGLKKIIIDPTVALIFICRGGARSREAATIMTKTGYTCYNVQYGFEGEADENGIYGLKNGWQHDNLPWMKV